MRPAEYRSRIRSAPWRPSRSRSPGSRASSASPCARPSTSPLAARKPSSPSPTTAGTPPTRVATTGRSAASASIAAAAPRREVEAVRDHLDPPAGRDAERDQVVAHLLAHRDERGRAGAERPLDERERPAPPRREVAAQDVAVEGVDERPGPARA